MQGWDTTKNMTATTLTSCCLCILRAILIKQTCYDRDWTMHTLSLLQLSIHWVLRPPKTPIFCILPFPSLIEHYIFNSHHSEHTAHCLSIIYRSQTLDTLTTIAIGCSTCCRLVLCLVLVTCRKLVPNHFVALSTKWSVHSSITNSLFDLTLDFFTTKSLDFWW